VAAAAALIAGFAGPVTAQPAQAATGEPVSVIVREVPNAGERPERVVSALGGTVDRQLSIIGGFSATVPADGLGVLRTTPGVDSVTENAAVHLNNTDPAQVQDATGSMYRITHDVTGATAMWEKGIYGSGIDVAVIDSGVVPVDGLRTPGKVVNGPDLSFEAQVCENGTCTASPTQHLDTYGHGTHMAGIIAGRDDNASAETYMNPDTFIGMAPGARVVSVKVADATGVTDVSQVIAAIDWVVQNRNRNGLNIRVLNLSFGTDGVQDYQLDPLTYAVETAWHSGIVVVVAAGNGGYGTSKLNNPAYDPYVIAVGGSDSRGTYDVLDDVVPSWSSSGDGKRNPDLVAPGASVIGLRVPGSFLDQSYPAARRGERLFSGSGTSQAAAVVSGASALLLSQRPKLTPDQVKALLVGSATKLPVADTRAQGAGTLDLVKAAVAKSPHPNTRQAWPRAMGTGSLEAARGSTNVTIAGMELVGEFDVMGRPWVPTAWASAAATGTSWSGGSMTGSGFVPGKWMGTDWYQTTLTGELPESGLEGLAWSGLAWSGLAWSGLAWSGLAWSGLAWSGLAWSGAGWGG
jgi:serine protease AprX